MIETEAGPRAKGASAAQAEAALRDGMVAAVPAGDGAIRQGAMPVTVPASRTGRATTANGRAGSRVTRTSPLLTDQGLGQLLSGMRAATAPMKVPASPR